MYRIAKQQPNKTLSQEYYASKILAMLRRDIINATTDEFTGATMDPIIVTDLVSLTAKKIKISGGGTAWEAQFEVEIDNDYNFTISFSADNEGNPRQAESEWTLSNFTFYDYETDQEHLDMKMSTDTIEELEKMVNEEMTDTVIEFAHQEYLEN